MCIRDRVDSGSLFENAVFALLYKKQKGTENLRFWRTVLKNKVDFVKLGEENLPIPFEAKLRVLGKPKIPSGILSFLRSYQPKEAFVVNFDLWRQVIWQKTKISFLPAWSI